MSDEGDKMNDLKRAFEQGYKDALHPFSPVSTPMWIDRDHEKLEAYDRGFYQARAESNWLILQRTSRR